jgi:hypothetical protein
LSTATKNLSTRSPMPGKTDSRLPAAFMGLAEFAKQLQTGALGGDLAMRTADNTGNAPGFSSGWPKGIDDMAKVGKAPEVAPD